jgi:hypothetical protein
MASELNVGGLVPPVTIAGSAGRGLAISNATDGYTNSIAVLDAPHSHGELSLKTVGTERLNISSAGLCSFSNGIAVTTGGVAFPATQSASADANTLDDYEEGEWSPTVTCSTAGSYDLHTGFDTCVYTKVGRLLSVQGKLYITGETGTPSGDIRISLPITSLGGLSDDSEYVVGSVDITSHGGTIDNVQANVGAAYAFMWLTKTAEDGTAATLTHADVDTDFWITFNFTYLA